MKTFRIKKFINARFYARVKEQDPNDCWPWIGNIDSRGYGVLCVTISKGRYLRVKAHRLAYMIFYGKFDKKLFVCHKCDNPGCVNPHHLFLGTCRDNIRDRDSKGRQARGETSGVSMLTEQDVKEIWRLRASGMRQKEIGERVQISKEQVSSVLTSRAWVHVNVKDEDKRKAGEVANSAGKGENNWNSKLDENDVYEIFKLRSVGMTQMQIAHRLNLSDSEVSMILSRKCWNRVSISEELQQIAKEVTALAHTGENSWRAKIVEDDVRKIFKLRGLGLDTRIIAGYIGISRSQVYSILNRNSWAHVVISGDVLRKVEQINKRNSRIKINGDIVREIFKLTEDGLKQRDIAGRIGISFQQVSRILNRDRWAHVKV